VKEKTSSTASTKTSTDSRAADTAATTDAAESVKDYIEEKLGVTDEELEDSMAKLGLTVQDLLQPSSLIDLVVDLTGAEDAVEIITNADLSESLKDILAYMNQAVAALNDDVTPVVNAADFNAADEQTVFTAEETVSEEEPKEVVVQQDETTEDTSSMKDFLDSKITVENTPDDTTSDTGSRKNELAGKHSQTAVTAKEMTVSENLAQNIQEVFDTVMDGELNQVDATSVVRQVVEAVKVAANQTMQSIEVQLNPENLGKINLMVSARNGVVTAQIATQNEQVKRAIESQMVMLKENLESQGVKIDAVEVTVQSHAFESGQNLQGNSSEQQNTKGAKKALKLDSLDDLSDDELSQEEAQAEKLIRSENSSVEYSA
jgi:flagellar hook-length control protein FliK